MSLGQRKRNQNNAKELLVHDKPRKTLDIAIYYLLRFKPVGI